MNPKAALAVGDLVKAVNTTGLMQNGNDPREGDLVTVTAIRGRHCDIRHADGRVQNGYLLTRFEKVSEAATLNAPLPGMADVKAAFAAGSADVRAALKKLYPTVAFTVTKTVPKVVALRDLARGAFFTYGGKRYQRVYSYDSNLGSLPDDGSRRFYAVTPEGRVCFFVCGEVTLTDANGTALTETKEVSL